MKTLELVRGSLTNPQLVREWLRSHGADSVPAEIGNNEHMLYYVINGRACVLTDGDEWLDYVDHKITEVADNLPKLEPFDKVLCRDNDQQSWVADLLGDIYTDPDSGELVYRCIGYQWFKCIPYEGNEHLLGTTNSPKGGER